MVEYSGKYWHEDPSNRAGVQLMDIETAFDLSGHEQRRAVVAILRETSPISRSRLTDRLAEESVETCGDSEGCHSDWATRRRIRIALHHNHLPRLADAGVIEYDGETVTATPELETLVATLDFPQWDTHGRTHADPVAVSDDFGRLLSEFYA